MVCLYLNVSLNGDKWGILNIEKIEKIKREMKFVEIVE